MLDNELVFFPDNKIENTPAKVGLEFDDIFFFTSDGVKLNGWFVSAQSDITLLWLHGNAGNISHRIENLLMIHKYLNVNIFIFDYRGYGLSEGIPSEQGLYLDSEAACEFLNCKLNIKIDKQLVIFGRSLGSAVGVNLAIKHKFRNMILESSFTSFHDIARIIYPTIPVSYMMKMIESRFDSITKIRFVNTPVMFVHGDKDRMVPIEIGRDLFNAANEPKHFYVIENADHNDTYLIGGELYFNAMKDFIKNTILEDKK